MKHIINIMVSAAVAAALSSCISLDTPPYDRETDLTFWTEDPNAALKTLNTCYTRLSSIEELVYSEGMTDNAYVKMPNGYTQSIGNGSYSTADGYVRSVWSSRYAGIRLCNELFANIDLVPGLSAELKNRYIGEAKVIMAYHYYELYTKFGAVPWIDKTISIEESKTISRTDRETVVSNILKELDEVINNGWLPTSYSGDDRGRITHYAAKAVKAKVLLFEGDWDGVYSLTSDIMQNGGYELFPSYSGLFETANEYNREIILDKEYRLVSNEHGIQYNFLPPSLGGYSLIAPLQELVDSYIMLNGKAISEAGSGYDANNPYSGRDPRLAATVMYTGNSYTLANGSTVTIDCNSGRDMAAILGGDSDTTPTGYYIKKFWDKDYRENLLSGLNPPIIRYADILLMNAEAAAELGTLDSGIWNNTVKAVRSRAGFTDAGALNFPSGVSKEGLIDIIRNERRSEFALEGLRHKDIIRWKIAETVLNGWCHGFYTGSGVGTDDGYFRVESRQFDAAKHYLWPIPQNDRDLNRNLSQNPNW